MNELKRNSKAPVGGNREDWLNEDKVHDGITAGLSNRPKLDDKGVQREPEKKQDKELGATGGDSSNVGEVLSTIRRNVQDSNDISVRGEIEKHNSNVDKRFKAIGTELSRPRSFSVMFSSGLKGGEPSFFSQSGGVSDPALFKKSDSMVSDSNRQSLDQYINDSGVAATISKLNEAGIKGKMVMKNVKAKSKDGGSESNVVAVFTPDRLLDEEEKTKMAGILKGLSDSEIKTVSKGQLSENEKMAFMSKDLSSAEEMAAAVLGVNDGKMTEPNFNKLDKNKQRIEDATKAMNALQHKDKKISFKGDDVSVTDKADGTTLYKGTLKNKEMVKNIKNKLSEGSIPVDNLQMEKVPRNIKNEKRTDVEIDDIKEDVKKRVENDTKIVENNKNDVSDNKDLKKDEKDKKERDVKEDENKEDEDFDKKGKSKRNKTKFAKPKRQSRDAIRTKKSLEKLDSVLKK